MRGPEKEVNRFAGIRMTKRSLVFVSLFILLQACTLPKDARVLKRATKEWRDSDTVLRAWADSPFSGVFLTLRDNGKFEHASSGLIRSYEAGTWTNMQDTIRLVYLDSRRQEIKKQTMIIDRQTSTLMCEGDSTPVQMRLKIIKNEMK